MNTEEHIKAVWKWLDENVQVFETPQSVTVSNFQIKTSRFSGSFDVHLDDVKLSERFSFGLGAHGKPDLFFPMFHSPLGAPASYVAIELTPQTTSAIKELLADVLPKMKALGLNRETGELIFHTTHTDFDRVIDKVGYEPHIGRVTASDFSKTRSLGHTLGGGTVA